MRKREECFSQEEALRREWENIRELSEERITFLLHREGKTVPQIARIRGLSETKVKEHLFLSKKQQMQKNEKNAKRPLLEKYLSMSREERETYLQALSEDEERRLISVMIQAAESNCQMEDLMVILWTAGEKKIPSLYDKLKFYCKHPHGNMRRICYSSMGKSGSAEFLPYVVQGFRDKKAQVRQYAVIAFGKLAEEDQLFMLEFLRKNKQEEDYVLRAAEKAIEAVKGRKGKREIDIEGV